MLRGMVDLCTDIILDLMIDISAKPGRWSAQVRVIRLHAHDDPKVSLLHKIVQMLPRICRISRIDYIQDIGIKHAKHFCLRLILFFPCAMVI